MGLMNMVVAVLALALLPVCVSMLAYDPWFIGVSFVTRMGNPVVARHQIQLHSSNHAGRANTAGWADGLLLELRHRA